MSLIEDIQERVMAGRDFGGTNCQCCGLETSLGVASVPGVPMSIAWCRSCLQRDIVPLWVVFAQAQACSATGREAFAAWWLVYHDNTLRYFDVSEAEFWPAVAEEIELEAAELAEMQERERAAGIEGLIEPW